MSPTSYQTAPPRKSSISHSAVEVKVFLIFVGFPQQKFEVQWGNLANRIKMRSRKQSVCLAFFTIFHDFISFKNTHKKKSRGHHDAPSCTDFCLTCLTTPLTKSLDGRARYHAATAQTNENKGGLIYAVLQTKQRTG